MPLNPIIEKSYDVLAHIATQTKFPAMCDGVQESLAFESELGSIKALSGYAKRAGILGAIATILHRIWNAVKAIFGQSDWQRAEKAVISLGKRAIPHLDQLFCFDEDQIAEMQILIDSSQFKEKISETFKEIIDRLNNANNDLQHIEEKIIPILNKIIASYDTVKIAADIFNSKHHIDITNLQKFKKLSHTKLTFTFISLADELYKKEYLKQEGFDNLKELLVSDEMPQLIKAFPELMITLFGIGLFCGTSSESEIFFSNLSTDSEESGSHSFSEDTEESSSSDDNPAPENIIFLFSNFLQSVVDENTIEITTKIKLKDNEIEANTNEVEAKAELEVKAKAEMEAKTKTELEAKAEAEREAKAKAEMEVKTKTELEAKAKVEVEAKAKAEMEAKTKTELEAKAKAEREAKAKSELEAKAKTELEAKAKAEVEAKAKSELEAKAKTELEAKAKAEVEAKAKAELEVKAKAELEAKAKAEVEAKAKAQLEAKTKTELEARAKAEFEAQARAEREAKAKDEAKAKAEEKAKLEQSLSGGSVLIQIEPEISLTSSFQNQTESLPTEIESSISNNTQEQNLSNGKRITKPINTDITKSVVSPKKIIVSQTSIQDESSQKMKNKPKTPEEIEAELMAEIRQQMSIIDQNQNQLNALISPINESPQIKPKINQNINSSPVGNGKRIPAPRSTTISNIVSSPKKIIVSQTSMQDELLQKMKNRPKTPEEIEAEVMAERRQQMSIIAQNQNQLNALISPINQSPQIKPKINQNIDSSAISNGKRIPAPRSTTISNIVSSPKKIVVSQTTMQDELKEKFKTRKPIIIEELLANENKTFDEPNECILQISKRRETFEEKIVDEKEEWSEEEEGEDKEYKI